VTYELFIAKRYLRSKRARGFVSVIAFIAAAGVVLGVAALIIMLSVTNGFTGEVKSRLIGMNAHVSITKHHGDTFSDYKEIIDKAGEFAGVAAASPVVERTLAVSPRVADSDVSGIKLWGIEPKSFGQVSDLPRNLKFKTDGEMLRADLPDQEYPSIILGEQLARRLMAGPGSEVLLWSLDQVEVSKVASGDFTPKLSPFVVTNTFASGMYHYDDNFAFVTLEDAQEALRLGDAVTHIHVRLDDIDTAIAVSEAMSEEWEYPFQIANWTTLFPELFKWMELEKWVIFIALSLIIVVAAFNIMSILVMSILVKTPEIGILRAMGATQKGIRRIFVYQGLAIGVVGTTLGCVLGLVVCILQQQYELIRIPGDIYIISQLPVDMQILDFVLVSAVSVVICLLGSIYPARKAASLMPVDAIRYVM
jgi:lipoprotein-releasing system permease protein